MTNEAAETEYWSQKLADAQRGQLDTVASAATAWTALLGSLLGVFGLVTFAGGLTAIDDLPEPWASGAKWLTIVAAALLATATLAAGVASQKLSPKTQEGMSWQTFKTETQARAKDGLAWLRLVKVTAVITALVVLVGSSIVLFVDAGPSTQKFVAVVDGVSACGPLEHDGEHIAVGGVPLLGDVTLTVVGKCPESG
jgi:hypothetical protein